MDFFFFYQRAQEINFSVPVNYRWFGTVLLVLKFMVICNSCVKVAAADSRLSRESPKRNRKIMREKKDLTINSRSTSHFYWVTTHFSICLRKEYTHEIMGFTPMGSAKEVFQTGLSFQAFSIQIHLSKQGFHRPWSHYQTDFGLFVKKLPFQTELDMAVSPYSSDKYREREREMLERWKR